MNNDSDKSDAMLEPTENDKPNELPALTERVGFCRPPRATRFKKGISGNPKGRPKGSLNVATAFLKALRERVVINEHGQRKTVTKLEAALKQLVNKAAGGDLRAIGQLRDLAREAEEKQNASAVQPGSVVHDLDQEVMQGILQRFQQKDEEGQPTDEVTDSEEIQGDHDE
jgi:hypothetical protein